MSHDLNKEHIEFEEWISTTKYKKMDGLWNPNLFRYTVMTIKQMLWETWLASRKIPYKFLTGLE